MKTNIIILASTLALVLGGCSAAPVAAPVAAPTTSAPTPPANGGTYGSVQELKDAFVEAGGICDSWDQSNHVTKAAESGSCSDQNVMSTYLSKEDITSMISSIKALNEEVDYESDAVWLTGENWVINDPAAAELRGKLGGVLVTF